MQHPRYIGAFFSGLALYSAAMLLSGSLANLQLPPAFHALFGDGDSLSQLLGEAAVYALPIFVMALGWSYATLRPYRRGRRPTTAWCVGGLALAWLGWLMYGVVRAANDGQIALQPIGALLLSPLVPPLWGLLNGLAVLAGVLLAGALAGRHALLRGLPPRH